MTLDRVDLPDPFIPMMAWTSPFGISRFTPLRISVSPIFAWRSFMMMDMVVYIV